jgi:hypothetical protein
MDFSLSVRTFPEMMNPLHNLAALPALSRSFWLPARGLEHAPAPTGHAASGMMPPGSPNE